MMWLLVLVTVAHVLAGVFWAGSSAVLARTGAAGIELLARPQLGAAVLAILMGGVLWSLNHRGAEGTGEHILGAGALCALAAAVLQAASLPKVRALATAQGADRDALRRSLALRQRIAIGLLAVTIAAMVSWRYF
jgi:hypothetical protein